MYSRSRNCGVSPMQSSWWAGSCMHGTAPGALPTHHRVRPKAFARFFLTPRHTPSVVPPVPSLPLLLPALFANSVGCRPFYRPSFGSICGLTFYDRIDPRDKQGPPWGTSPPSSSLPPNVTAEIPGPVACVLLQHPLRYPQSEAKPLGAPAPRLRHLRILHKPWQTIWASHLPTLPPASSSTHIQ